MAGKRQVKGAKVALQHNVGLGGACIVTMYRHGFPDAAAATSSVVLIVMHITHFSTG